jgi:hypothetical protein
LNASDWPIVEEPLFHLHLLSLSNLLSLSRNIVKSNVVLTMAPNSVDGLDECAAIPRSPILE